MITVNKVAEVLLDALIYFSPTPHPLTTAPLLTAEVHTGGTHTGHGQ